MGGSFNPVHIGHILLADYIAQFTDIDKVWLMLSPQNPLKRDNPAAVSDRHRLEMLAMACLTSPRLEPTDIELSMPRPSYTIDSLTRLQSLHPDCRFRLIIGSDNWQVFDRWRCHEEIIRRFSPIIYPRPGSEIEPADLPADVSLVDAPTFDISSTFIRNAIAAGHDMDLFLPAGVGPYINQHNLYR